MFRSVFLLLASLLLVFPAAGQTPNYAHFEARQTHPLGLTPDGTKLLALNSPEARLSVFDISNAANPVPVLVAEIPVGLEPVSLRARTDDEVWVVNELSDSLSVVSLSLGVTVATLAASDEPADVVFAQNKAFVSCARNNLVRVFNATTREELSTIPLEGVSPRALAADAAGSKVFVAFQLSGNRTTTLPAAIAPNPPAPTNPALPGAPKTGLIVAATDPRVPYTVLDRDVAEIGVAESRVYEYYSDVGTNLFDLAPQPGTGALWIANTDARNLTRFEPELRGHFVDNRATRLVVPQGIITHYDLNPDVDYSRLPNPASQATSLTQPTALVFPPDGASLWIAAFGSDRVARLSASDGTVLARVDLRPAGEGARKMRGPRGLALHPTRDRLYVLNKLANTISVLDTTAAASSALLAETPVASHEPMPVQIKEGRGFLFDARLSGNGTASCASCHLDADRDGLAWDLGDPGGSMVTVTGYNNSIHDLTPKDRVLHPMKGPMTTQTLRGMQETRLFHWRGDRPSLQSFNVTFSALMGGPELAAAEIDALAAYLQSLRHHPNPNRQLDRSLPGSFANDNPTSGRALFNNHQKSHCVTCHALPTGSDENIDLMAEVGSSQPIKTVPLRTVYQRARFDGTAGATNASGYGLLHDGTGFRLPIAHFYVLDNLETLQELNDVTAFLMCFDTGTAPAVGASSTVTADTAAAAATDPRLATIEAQAAVPNTCDLVARGRVGGRWTQLWFDPVSQHYATDAVGGPALTRAGLLGLLGPGDALTFLGTLPGDGPRFGGDRDGDGVPDANEPLPALEPEMTASALRLLWPLTARDVVAEESGGLEGPWHVVAELRRSADPLWATEWPRTDTPTRFFRLRRTW